MSQIAVVHRVRGSVEVVNRRPEPLWPGAARVAVHTCLIDRRLRPGRTREFDLGGVFVGRIVGAASDVERTRHGTMVLGAVRSGACASSVTVGAAALSPIGDNDAMAALLAAGPGLRAKVMVRRLEEFGIGRVVVLGAAGGTGCALGGLLARSGVEAAAVTATHGASAALSQCGYASVFDSSAADPATLAAFIRDAAPTALIDCGYGAQLEAMPGTITTDLRRFRYSEPVGEGEPAGQPDRNHVNVVRECIEGPDLIAREFTDVCQAIENGTVRLPVTMCSLHDLALLQPLLHGHRHTGALVVQPT